MVTEGEKAEVICQATGKPQPEIQWIQSTDHKVVAKGIDGRLFIEKVTRDQNIDYTCQASNKGGIVTRNVHFSVRSKPEVTDVKNGTAVVGTFGQIQCIVYANPKPSIKIRYCVDRISYGMILAFTNILVLFYYYFAENSVSKDLEEMSIVTLFNRLHQLLLM